MAAVVTEPAARRSLPQPSEPIRGPHSSTSISNGNAGITGLQRDNRGLLGEEVWVYDSGIPPVISPRVPYTTVNDPAPPIDVNDLASYAAQLVLDPGSDGTVVIVPASAQLDPGMLGWVPKVDHVLSGGNLGFTVVSAWNTRGTPAGLRDNMLAHHRLVTRALQLDPESVPTGVFAADRTWAELSVAVRTAPPALELAQEFGAPAVVSYGAFELSVIRAADGEQLEKARTVRLSRPHQCPLLVDAEIGQLCKMHGGPYIRRSIEAAAFWQIHRKLLLLTLGCTVCENGRFTQFPGQRKVSERATGGPKSLIEETTASRWGGPFRQGYATGARIDGLL